MSALSGDSRCNDRLEPAPRGPRRRDRRGRGGDLSWREVPPTTRGAIQRRDPVRRGGRRGAARDRPARRSRRCLGHERTPAAPQTALWVIPAHESPKPTLDLGHRHDAGNARRARRDLVERLRRSCPGEGRGVHWRHALVEKLEAAGPRHWSGTRASPRGGDLGPGESPVASEIRCGPTRSARGSQRETESASLSAAMAIRNAHRRCPAGRNDAEIIAAEPARACRRVA